MAKKPKIKIIKSHKTPFSITITQEPSVFLRVETYRLSPYPLS